MSDGMPGRVIYAVTALATFYLLVSMASSDLSGVESDDYQVISVPDYLTLSDMIEYNITNSANGTLTLGGDITLTIVSDEHKVYLDWDTLTPSVLQHTHMEKGWWIFWNYDTINPNPTNFETIIDQYDESANATRLILSCNHNQWIMEYAYNQTAYTSMQNAYDNGDMDVWVGMGDDIASGQLGAWALVTSILLWQNPDIHVAVNAMIAIPLYALMGVIAFYLFTTFIKAIKPVG